MDHSLEELDNCIFDYLVSNADKYKSVRQIYNDITKSTGHRCSDLSMYTDDYGINLVYSKCLTLKDKFKNISISDGLFSGYSLKLIYKTEPKYRFDEKDTIGKYVKNDIISMVKILLDEYYYNDQELDELVDIAIDFNNSKIIKVLLDHKYKRKINKLENEIDSLKNRSNFNFRLF